MPLPVNENFAVSGGHFYLLHPTTLKFFQPLFSTVIHIMWILKLPHVLSPRYIWVNLSLLLHVANHTKR